MSHDDESRAVLMVEIDAGIERLERNPHQQACPAHAHVIDGIILLLRCQRARLNDREGWKAGSIGGAIGAILAGVGIVIMRYLGIG
jgi:hypothetical protein